MKLLIDKVKWLFFSILHLVDYFSELSVAFPSCQLAAKEYYGSEHRQRSLKISPPLDWEGSCPKKASKCPKSFRKKTPSVLISYDGFRSDFIDSGLTPTLKKLSKCGTHAPFMYPVFPTVTLANHASMVTGVYPPIHGFIDNSMYDPLTEKSFKTSTDQTAELEWLKREPIFGTAEKQGVKTASFSWFGSGVEFNGSKATYFKDTTSIKTFEEIMDQVLKWLDLPEKTRPQLITAYFGEPDQSLHTHGVYSRQANNTLKHMDEVTKLFYSGLQKRKLVNCVNVIFVSDHGMSSAECSRVIDLNDYAEEVKYKEGALGPFGRLNPSIEGSKTQINEIVSKLKCRNKHMRVYHKEQLPIRYHYADSVRIEPIFLDLDAGWTVSKGTLSGSKCTGGVHGYDNMHPEMRALFIAEGPAFKRNYISRRFINTELYEMLAELLKIKPNPNNGTRGSLHHILKQPRKLTPQKKRAPPAVGCVPRNETLYKLRLKSCKCSSFPVKKQTNVKNAKFIRGQHLPFGIPYSPQDNETLRLLYNKDYVSAFHLKFRMPMWSSFTLKGKKQLRKLGDIDWIGDTRIYCNDAAKCTDYDSSTAKEHFIVQRPLYPPAFSKPSSEEATLVTNSIPKTMNHSEILEEAMNEILKKWLSQSGELNVITGPAFNFDATEIRPPTEIIEKNRQEGGSLIVPTHIFVIVTWCKEKKSSLKKCKRAKLDAHGFLLPNKPYTDNCEKPANVIKRNIARVVDIEKLTGISFYTELPIYDAIRLRTVMPERDF